MSGVEQSVLYMKVTEALRAASPSNLAELAKTYNIADFPNLLVLAVELSPYETVAWVVKMYLSKGRNLNEVDPQTGSTALHVAVANNRNPVVRDLLALPQVDDTIRNKEGMTAMDLASGVEMESTITHAENEYAEKMSLKLKQSFKERNIPQLEAIYANPRVAQVLNIDGLDPDTGRSVLHDAAHANDIAMVRFILAHGGDPMVKERKTQRLPQDLTSSGEIQMLLNNSAKSRAILDQTSGSNERSGTADGAAGKSAPTMEGFLKKWTNLTSGYKLRYFHLKDGELAYYKKPEDLKKHRPKRGKIYLHRASVRLDSSEKNKFEIHDEHKNRFFLKATHPADTNKWVWVLKEAITYSRDQEKQSKRGHQRQVSGATAGSTATTNAGNGAGANAAGANASTATAPSTPKAPGNGAVGAAAAGAAGAAGAVGVGANAHGAAPSDRPSKSPLNIAPVNSSGQPFSPTQPFSPSSATPNADLAPVSPTEGRASSTKSGVSGHSVNSHPFEPAQRQYSAASISGASTHRRKQSSVGSQNEWLVNDLAQKDDEVLSDEDDYDDELVLRGPKISAESIIARLTAIKDLMTMLVFQVQDETMRDAITTVQGSIDVLSSDIVMLQRQARARLHMSNQDFERSEKNQRMWASNYRDLEMQFEKMEGELHRLRKQVGGQESDDDEFFDTFDNAGTEERRTRQTSVPSVPQVPQEHYGEHHARHLHQGEHQQAHSEPPSQPHSQPPSQPPSQAHSQPVSQAHLQQHTADHTPAHSVRSGFDGRPGGPHDGPHGDGPQGPPSGPHDGPHGAAAGAAGAGAAGVGAAGAAEAVHHHHSEGQYQQPQQEHQEHHQHHQPQQEQHHQPPQEEIHTNPHNTQAQAEAEHRMLAEKSFAGYENPPRSRLKLDADNRPKLSLWGILKNLIGKDMTKMTLPVTFNECTSLLQRSAEDMEYVDLLDHAAEAVDDAGLRMAFVAAFAGSSYSSTINRVAKPFNPLLGETYEYARKDKGYRLFSEQVSHHPPIGALMAESKNWDFYGESNVESKFYGRSFDINPLGLWYLNLRPDKGAGFEEELYSYRKLTSSVVGIMVGNPVVDNYGDMTITNHTNGVKAVVSYKARGWRGASAYKLQGHITDKDGKELWTIAGQWNDKMWAMKSGSDKKILLWEAHPRHKTPFNLTDFAITLNDLNPELEPWLPPTDTRLRPDQRAMEEGRYDDASDDKSRVEDKQRAARRQREEQGIQYKPQWFELVKHPVTGLDYYRPINQYWQQRADHNLADKGDIF